MKSFPSPLIFAQDFSSYMRIRAWRKPIIVDGFDPASVNPRILLLGWTFLERRRLTHLSTFSRTPMTSFLGPLPRASISCVFAIRTIFVAGIFIISQAPGIP